MSLVTELADRPLVERIQAMEQLWDSLCRESNYNPSPAWHEKILTERRAELQRGEHKSWQEVKAGLSRGIEADHQCQ